MLLFFDTETTGKWVNTLKVGDPNQPKIVQIAATLTTEDGVEVMSINLPVYQDHVPAEAAAIHGKTTEVLAKIGLNEGTVLTIFEEMLALADTVIAHNGEFDQKVVMNALTLLDGKPSNPFETKKAFCTMRASTPVCQIKGPRGFKWPTLQEAYTHFHGQAFDGAHDAMADVTACKAIYFALLDLIAQSKAEKAAKAG